MIYRIQLINEKLVNAGSPEEAIKKFKDALMMGQEFRVFDDTVSSSKEILRS